MGVISYRDLSSNSTTKLDYDVKAVENSIKNILLTKRGEFPGKPEFGSNIHEYLFSMDDGLTQFGLELEVRYSIERWEPRCIIEGVKVETIAEYNRIVVMIGYSIVKDPSNSIYDLTIKLK